MSCRGFVLRGKAHLHVALCEREEEALYVVEVERGVAGSRPANAPRRLVAVEHADGRHAERLRGNETVGAVIDVHALVKVHIIVREGKQLLALVSRVWADEVESILQVELLDATQHDLPVLARHDVSGDAQVLQAGDSLVDSREEPGLLPVLLEERHANLVHVLRSDALRHAVLPVEGAHVVGGDVVLVHRERRWLQTIRLEDELHAAVDDPEVVQDRSVPVEDCVGELHRLLGHSFLLGVVRVNCRVYELTI